MLQAENLSAEKLARLEEMLERQDILDCQLRFARGMDRFDRELFLSAFHDDAVIAAGEYVGGPKELYDWAIGLHEQGQSGTMHNILNHNCDIDGDTAHTETYYQFVGRNRDDTNWVAGGRYVDRLERRNGEWKIAMRTNEVEWAGMVPTMPLPFSEVPGIELNGVASRSKDDPSYQRPLVNRRERHIPH